MRNGILTAAAMAMGLLAAGCATSGKAQQAEAMDTRVAALEGQVTALEQRIDELQQSQVAPAEAPARSAEGSRGLRPSGKGHLTVRQLQRALASAGYYQGPVDGKAGPKTRKAIRDFQEANGLKADGVVGPATSEALAKHLHPDE